MEESAADVATTLSVADVVADRYRIDALIGLGGMGVVYRATHLHLRKALALKVLLPEWSSTPEVVARFEREAIAASHIESPHVAAATDFGRLANGSFFLVMEYVEGRTLRGLLEAGAIEAARALRIARGIASGLHAAHSLGIVHRDMKPENIMLVDRDGDPDFVKLLDFGIAKVSGFGTGSEGGASGVLTRVGAVIGTPEYMAPEQAMGQAIDPRTDLYSVGVILFEMLAGKPPFVGAPVTMLRQHVLDEAPDLRLEAPADAALRIAAVVRRLLAKSVDDRFGNAAELLDALDACLRELGRFESHSATESFRHPLSVMRQPARKPIFLGAAVAAVLVTSLVTLLALARARGSIGPTATPVASSAEVSVASAAPPTAAATAAEDDVVPPAIVLPPPPAPSASSVNAAGSTTPALSGEHRPATQRKSRRTGPGGIYIPPPSEWFK